MWLRCLLLLLLLLLLVAATDVTPGPVSPIAK